MIEDKIILTTSEFITIVEDAIRQGLVTDKVEGHAETNIIVDGIFNNIVEYLPRGIKYTLASDEC